MTEMYKNLKKYFILTFLSLIEMSNKVNKLRAKRINQDFII